MGSLLRHPNYYKKIFTFFFISSSTRMSGKSMSFGDKKIWKSNLYKNKKVIRIDSIDVNKILVFKEELYGSENSFKYFIGHNDNDVTRPLCIKLPQMIGYVNTRKVTRQFLLRLVTNNC